jgi:hypothetical protein
VIGVLQGTLPENTDMEFVSKTTFSAVSSVSVDNCFSASYTHYLVTRNLLGSSAGASLNVRLRVSSTDDSGANYRYQHVNASSTVVSGARGTAQTSWLEGLGYTEATAAGYGQLRISNPFEAVRTTAWTDRDNDATANIVLRHLVYAHDTASSYTSLSVIPDVGTITGSITVYGIAV